MRSVYFSRKTLILGLKIEKIIVSTEYSDFTNVFFSNFATKLLDHFKINNYFIYLQKDKQLCFGLIYSLELVKLESLKSFIETNLASNFIKLLKLLSGVLILFIYKKDNGFWLCINY